MADTDGVGDGLRGSRASDGAPGVEHECKLFVGGISWHMTDSELQEKFAPYGPCDAKIMLDRHTGRSRGFGFVTYEKHSDGEAAVKAIHDSEFDGRKVSVTKAIPQSQTAPGTPASMIGRRGGDRYGDRRYERPYHGRERREPYPERGYDRGYDRAPYPDTYGYDRGGLPADYGRDRYVPAPYGYDSRDGYGYDPREAYGRYEREAAYPDPRAAAYYSGGGYEREPAGYEYDRPPYGGGGYERSGAGPYPPYARSANGGPDRARYGGGSRPTPYERGPAPRGDRGPGP